MEGAREAGGEAGGEARHGAGEAGAVAQRGPGRSRDPASRLGDLHICDSSGRTVASLEAQPKRAALLIYLACLAPGSFITRDQLLALFWPDFDDERARNSLRSSLYYVRRAIGPGVVHGRPDGALTADPQALWCDVRAFDAGSKAGAWSEATELYRGDFLEGGGFSVSVEYDQWMEATRRRLRRQCADALYRIADAREIEGDLEGALAALGRARTLLAADEAVLRRVLALLGRMANRVRAVQEYQVFARTLSDLYALEPSPETRELLDRVTAGDLPAAGTTRRAASAPPPLRSADAADAAPDDVPQVVATAAEPDETPREERPDVTEPAEAEPVETASAPATVPTSGPPVPLEWARVTGKPADLGVMAAALVRGIR